MLRCIIIEDEQNAREYLEHLIERYFSSKIVVLAACPSISEGVEAIKKFQPDLVFLDIQMPNERGFKLFDYFDTIKFEVIFTTAHKEFAIEAIQHSAQDYLLKPIGQLDLAEAIKRLEKKNERKNISSDVGRIIEHYNADPFNFGKIALVTEKGFILEKIGNILFAEAQGNYTKIYTFDNRTLLVCKTLRIIEEMLPQKSFFRIHKSYVVNLNYLTKYDKSIGLFVELINGTKLPVSVRNNAGLIHAITSKD
jgi:two-component system LytT family response regulator